MNKILLTIILIAQLISAATPEQVESYLEVSHAEDELLNMESAFEAMQRKMEARDGNASTYDTELLSIRFREHLQKALSKNEMEKVLDNYKNEVLLKFAAGSSDSEENSHEAFKYANELEKDSEAKVRIKLVEKINKLYNNKEAMLIMFDGLIGPIMTKMGPKKATKEYMEKSRESFLKSMIENGKNEILYATKEFSMDELDELLKIVKTPAVGYEVKAVTSGIVYTLKEFMEIMADRMGHVRH